MKYSLSEKLCCNKCQGDLHCQDLDLKVEGNEIESGTLACVDCGERFPIINGVPAFNTDALDKSITAKAFSEQWDGDKRHLFEKKDVFGLTVDDYVAHFCYAFSIKALNLLHGLVIEAGIGSGCLVIALAKESPRTEVIGMDISNVVFSLAAYARELPNLHLIQCDLTNPPLKKGIADKVYSSGVLHHLHTPLTGLSSLWGLLNGEGNLYFWVYPSYSYCAYDRLRKMLGKPFKWPMSIRYSISWLLSPFMWAYFFITKCYSYKTSQETLGTIAFRIFDNVSPEFQHRVSKDDIAAWCKSVEIEHYRIVNDLGVVCSRQNIFSNGEHR